MDPDEHERVKFEMQSKSANGYDEDSFLHSLKYVVNCYDWLFKNQSDMDR